MRLRIRYLTLILLSGIFTIGTIFGSPVPTLHSEVCAEAVTTPISIKIRGPFLIEREGYSVCYDGRTRNPIWVYERLSKENLRGDAVRLSRFFEDGSLPKHVRSTNGDYSGSSYDRGHLAAAGNHKNSQSAMNETFFLTNISPQTGVFLIVKAAPGTL